MLDEMYGEAIADPLRRAGIDAIALVSLPGMAGSSDDEVLSLAAELDRTLVSNNVRDYAILDAAWREQGRRHAGIWLVHSGTFPQDRSLPGNLVRAISAAAKAKEIPAAGAISYLRKLEPGSQRGRQRR